MALGKPVLFCLGASHKSAKVEFRERLFLNNQEIALALPQVAELQHVTELALLSTCNRFELFGVCHIEGDTSKFLLDTYMTIQKCAGKHLDFDLETLKSHTYILKGEDAINHVFAVASSIDSLIIGETQITGQFKQAIELAKNCELVGPVLNRLSQEALAVAKKVRNQTDIGTKTVSISHAAIDLAKRVFGNIANHKILIIGAGDMARVAAQYAGQYTPDGLMVANRTYQNAVDLVTKMGFGEAYHINDLVDLLETVDIVISSTSAPGIIISESMIKRAMRQRNGRNLFLVDIAIPRDIESTCGKLDDVFLFEVDDLRQVVNENLEERRRASVEAKTFIDAATSSFTKWLTNQGLKPAIAGFRSYLDSLMQQEFERSVGKELFANLSEAQLEALQRMQKSLAAKISGDAARNVHAQQDERTREQLADALGLLFVAPESKKDFYE